MKNIPELAKYIIQKLNEHEFDAYLVGGCVRDSILNKEPKDWDITTNAKPEEVIDLFKDNIYIKAIVPTGIDFGTVTIVGAERNDSYEVTTFRGDIYAPETGISHKPRSVEYVDNIIKDLSRRDFTMNAIAYDITKEEFIDPYDGMQDILDNKIKCVGNPIERFKEDPLRMLRAIRFASVLNFKIDVNTKTSIMLHSDLIKEMSAERIREELNKILLLGDLEAIFYGINSNATKVIFDKILPELTGLEYILQNNPYHYYNAFTHSIEAARIIEPKLHLKLAALLHDLGKICTLTTDENGIDHFYGHGEVSCKIAEDVLEKLKYSNDVKDKVLRLIKHHDRRIELTDKAIKKAIRVIGEDIFFDFCSLRYADITAQELKYLKPRAKKIFAIEKKAKEIIESKQPFEIKDLEVNGHDIIKLGVKPGPKIRVILEYLLELVMENPEANYKDYLIMKATEFLLARNSI